MPRPATPEEQAAADTIFLLPAQPFSQGGQQQEGAGLRLVALCAGILAGFLVLAGSPYAAMTSLVIGLITVVDGWTWLRGRWPR